MPLEEQLTMNLVRADDHIVAEANLGHLGQFLAREHSPHRVVGIAEQEHAECGGVIVRSIRPTSTA